MSLTLNLTQHPATPEQVQAGVLDLQGNALEALKANLTFSKMPDKKGILERAKRIAQLARSYDFEQAMIGGAPYLMSALEEALREIGITPVYSFSERVSQEELQSDGTVRKISTFKHQGFIEV